MKTLLRTLLFLSLVVWLGAEFFLPVVAATTFGTLAPNTHAAGLIVGGLLRILHGMGMVSGMVALALLALAPTWNLYQPKAVLPPMVFIVLMLAITVYSQYGIIPAMERDRIAAGGAIDTTRPEDPNTADFNKLHNRSETLEIVIMLLGIGAVATVARAESRRG